MERVENSPKYNSSRVVVGIILIIGATLILFDNFGFYDVSWNHYFFTWQALLIIIGLIFVAKRESKNIGLILIAIGTFFLISKCYHFPVTLQKLFWPAILAFIGLSLIFRNRGRHFKPTENSGSKNEYIDDVSIFGGSEQRFNSQNFQGGSITSIFGGSTFDLSSAQLAPGVNTLEVFCMFGGSKLIIPPGWKIKIDAISIFGGISDKRNLHMQNSPESSPELVVKGLVLFGGMDIKSF